MNIYIVVEGEVGEKKVYECWIPYVNPNLSSAPTLSAVRGNHFYIISGGGYPNYFEVIRNAIWDVATIKQSDSPLFDRLVISIDSEDMSLQDKQREIVDFAQSIMPEMGTGIDYRVIIQHFCLETWGLGNRRIVSRNVRGLKLKEYKTLYNVGVLDPEGLPSLPIERLNRSQFAAKYLRLLLNEKFKNLTYTKSNPGALLHENYFLQVKNRYHQTGHIESFHSFLNAFV